MSETNDGPDPARPELCGPAWAGHPMLPAPYAIGARVQFGTAKREGVYQGRTISASQLTYCIIQPDVEVHYVGMVRSVKP